MFLFLYYKLLDPVNCSGEDDVVNIVPSLPGGSWKPKWL